MEDGVAIAIDVDSEAEWLTLTQTLREKDSLQWQDITGFYRQDRAFVVDDTLQLVRVRLSILNCRKLYPANLGRHFC